jgi:hypothetical protein
MHQAVSGSLRALQPSYLWLRILQQAEIVPEHVPLARHSDNHGLNMHLMTDIASSVLMDKRNVSHQYKEDSRCPTSWTSQPWESVGNC